MENTEFSFESSGRRWLVPIVLIGGACLAAAAFFLLPNKNPDIQYTPIDYKNAGLKCMSQGDYDCAEKNFSRYVTLRPTDAQGRGTYGILLNMRDRHEAAIAEFEKAIDLGEGNYQLFSYYADSLGKSGKPDDAIDWSYKALAVLPELGDVRGSLAKLLVLQKRYYEALSLLGAYDEHLSSIGHRPYFEGQRIAIEEAARRAGQVKSTESAQLRLPKVVDHYYAPVTIGEARPNMFVVDTGAARTTLSEKLLASSKVAYEVIEPDITIRNADGRASKARLVNIESLRVGDFDVRNVNAIVCGNCVGLLGQATLAQFDLVSSKVQGVEFVTLTPRKS